MAKSDIIPVRIVDDANRTNSLIVSKAAVVTPSDATILDAGVLFVGSAGDVAVVMANDTVAVTFKNVPDGTFLPILVKQVYDTGTDATDILILY